jgi:threonine dehydratase
MSEMITPDNNWEKSELPREVVQEERFAEYMTEELVEKWGDGIPEYSERDPEDPEWRPTRVVPLDLRSEGFGEVYVKDESDPESNQTETLKDRPAWELATLYRDLARGLYLKMKQNREFSEYDLRSTKTPRFSLVTAGNEGRAVANMFAKYELPPPKLIVGRNVAESILEELKELRADIYKVDLSQKLSPEDIKRCSNNQDGVSITSSMAIEPHAIFYDWQTHEVFNESPDDIYVPYGSGRLMENYVYWQNQTLRNESTGNRDPRLEAQPSQIISANVFGAEPQSLNSVADKLTAKFKPFLLFKDEDISDFISLQSTGRRTGKYGIEDKFIDEASRIFQKHDIQAEPSAAAGLALYIKRYESGEVDEGRKSLIVNTGKGLTEESVADKR